MMMMMIRLHEMQLMLMQCIHDVHVGANLNAAKTKRKKKKYTTIETKLKSGQLKELTAST